MAKYRVLVADALSDEGLAVLKQHPDIEVVKILKLKGEELAKELRQSDCVLVRSQPQITADVLKDAGKCRIIGRAGIGVDNVDVAAATAAGIIVMNTPGGNSVTTAEHTLAMLFAVARTLPQAHAKLAQGVWDKNNHTGAELYNKTLGVIGLGNIGGIVADRAKGLKMKILGFDPYVTAEKAAEKGIELATLDEIYQRADFITLHIPLSDETRNMISTKQFAMMKPTARIINCARGGIIDEAALLVALNEGKIAGAALDVFETEPVPAGHPLLNHPKIVTTPHLGASTVEAQVNVAVQVCEQAVAYLIHGDIRNAVNAPTVSGEVVKALGPQLKLGQILGKVHRQLLTGAVQAVSVKFVGDFVRYDLEPVVREVLVGLLEGTLEQAINAINVREVANKRSIEVQVSSSKKSTGYSASVEVEVRSASGSLTLVGAVFGDNEVRLVRFGEFHLDGIEPEGTIVAIQNGDKPGVVGAVGTFLGQNNINIARLQVSRNRKDGQAMMFLQIDGALPDTVRQELAKLDAVKSVAVLRL